MRRPETRPRLRLLIELAARDLWHDRKVSLCIVASLVAVIALLQNKLTTSKEVAA